MTHALPLRPALACASDPAAALPDSEAVEVRVHDFVRLTPADAARPERSSTPPESSTRRRRSPA